MHSIAYAMLNAKMVLLNQWINFLSNIDAIHKSQLLNEMAHLEWDFHCDAYSFDEFILPQNIPPNETNNITLNEMRLSRVYVRNATFGWNKWCSYVYEMIQNAFSCHHPTSNHAVCVCVYAGVCHRTLSHLAEQVSRNASFQAHPKQHMCVCVILEMFNVKLHFKPVIISCNKSSFNDRNEIFHKILMKQKVPEIFSIKTNFFFVFSFVYFTGKHIHVNETETIFRRYITGALVLAQKLCQRE